MPFDSESAVLGVVVSAIGGVAVFFRKTLFGWARLQARERTETIAISAKERRADTDQVFTKVWDFCHELQRQLEKASERLEEISAKQIRCEQEGLQKSQLIHTLQAQNAAQQAEIERLEARVTELESATH